MIEKFPVTRLIYVGVTLLGYPEKDVWRMTPRKLLLLYEEYKRDHGQSEIERDIDSMIPL